MKIDGAKKVKKLTSLRWGISDVAISALNEIAALRSQWREKWDCFVPCDNGITQPVFGSICFKINYLRNRLLCDKSDRFIFQMLNLSFLIKKNCQNTFVALSLFQKIEDRLRLGIKNKQVCFVLHSACAIFASKNVQWIIMVIWGFCYISHQ